MQVLLLGAQLWFGEDQGNPSPANLRVLTRGPEKDCMLPVRAPPGRSCGAQEPPGPWEGEASALDLLQGPALDLSLDLLGPGKHNARVPELSAGPLGMSEGYPGI